MVVVSLVCSNLLHFLMVSSWLLMLRVLMPAQVHVFAIILIMEYTLTQDFN